jgi:transposase-like protein
VQYYGPELEQRLRRHLKPTNKSWRVDETYIRVKGRWCYLYPREGSLVLLVSDHRFRGCHHRFLAVSVP